MEFVYSIVYNEFNRAKAPRQYIQAKAAIKIITKENYREITENKPAK